ncbi:hypothetical protein H2204_006838 [Knufia peltigerae]|uniref:Major facilitator superfamily (MFS) profile domain-containing protein n=1 Tax=Knufia peltigerae TaxID=1002370 RepID=A0AA38Y3B2_9EURO|nr:hypothetical protein H2204_006838 [Knufia peltigerae]
MIAELPGNMALVKFGVAKTLAFLMLALGVSTLAQGHTKHWGVLAFCRVLVGAFEASIFPACIYLISSWYVRYEAHKMLAILYSIGLVASSFAGVLAYALALLEGHAGWLGWRWIFTIEGAVTAAFAIPTYFFIVDFPDRATFLSQREREIRMQELNEDRGDAATSQVTLKNLKDLKGELAIEFILHTSLIIRRLDHLARHVHGLGYSGLQANLYSAPPYLVAVGFLLLSSYFADRMQRRLPLVIIQGCIGIVGLATILIFGQNNVVGSSKRSVASVLNIAGGTIGGLLGSTIYLQKEAPTYTTGLGVTMALQACLIITSIAAWAKLSSYNRAADNERAVFNGAESWRWTL